MIGGGSLGLSVQLRGEFSLLIQGSRFDTLGEKFDSNNVVFLTNPPAILYFIL
jgi:hypothetical protein